MNYYYSSCLKTEKELVVNRDDEPITQGDHNVNAKMEDILAMIAIPLFERKIYVLKFLIYKSKTESLKLKVWYGSSEPFPCIFNVICSAPTVANFACP